jgi:lipid-binding SYLF domain-containing protein
MKIKPTLYLTLACFLTLALGVAVPAQDPVKKDDKTTERSQDNKGSNDNKAQNAPQKKSDDFKDAVEQSKEAAETFTEIMNAPDKGIPQELLERAECVAVFPDVFKIGFIVGGRAGRGVASCRIGNTWSAPAFLNIGGGDFGAQIGAESTDYVMLFMTKESVKNLLSNKVELGGEVSVAAGPVGRTAAAATDVALKAQILSYSRSKGLFAGAVVKGGAITRDGDTMRAVYGENVSTKEVVQESKVKVSPEIRVFPDTLARHTTMRAKATR